MEQPRKLRQIKQQQMDVLLRPVAVNDIEDQRDVIVIAQVICVDLEFVLVVC